MAKKFCENQKLLAFLYPLKSVFSHSSLTKLSKDQISIAFSAYNIPVHNASGASHENQKKVNPIETLQVGALPTSSNSAIHIFHPYA